MWLWRDTTQGVWVDSRSWKRQGKERSPGDTLILAQCDPFQISDEKSQLTGKKTLMLGKRRERQDEMVGWHHWFNRQGFEQTQGDITGQGRLAWCSSWGCKELDTTYRLNNNRKQTQSGRVVRWSCCHSLSYLNATRAFITSHLPEVFWKQITPLLFNFAFSFHM